MMLQLASPEGGSDGITIEKLSHISRLLSVSPVFLVMSPTSLKFSFSLP